MDGEVVVFVVGVGIGGIVCGVVCVLKKYNLNVYIVVVEFVFFLVFEGGKVVLYCI